MNRSIAVIVQAVWGGSALLACTSMPQNTMPLVKPNYEVRHGGAAAQMFYQLGRHYQGEHEFVRAEDAYRHAIAAQKDHAEAHNALGTVLASLGRYEEACISFAQALEISPMAAHVHNNLGYTYLLWQRDVDAMTPLQRANELEPNNPVYRNNLALAQGLAPTATVGRTPRVESSAPLPAVLAVASTSEGSTPVAAPQPARFEMVGTASRPLLAVVSERAMLPVIDIPSLSSRPAADVVTPQPPMPTPPVRPAATLNARSMDEARVNFRLELANGNGVTGMARYVRQLLLVQGLPKARVTNERPFIQAHTTIEYRQGFEAQARNLSEQLPGRPLPRPWARPQGDLRVVLGHDMPRTLDFELLAHAPLTALGTGELRGPR